jgi:hypothetical protein
LTIPTPGQIARVAFTGAASQRVSLNLLGVTITNGNIWLYKPDGAALGPVLSFNTIGAFMDPRTLPVAGTYTLVIDPNFTNTGNITLTLYDVPADPTGSLTVGGGGQNVSISVPGQNATLTFSGTSSQQVTVRLTRPHKIDRSREHIP